MNARAALPAFSAYGIELEYMIVDRDTLAVLPVADELLAGFDGKARLTGGAALIGWSNELVRHVVEVKNVSPVPELSVLPSLFHDEVRAANRRLASRNGRLMPTAMHPWMDPASETSIWDHDIYRAYDRIYGCRGHGWSNLQSMHINLPFADDRQFARLHAAVRLILPLLPALASSSPIAEGKPTGLLDFRLDAYRKICSITPTVSGLVVPDTVSSRAEYEASVLEPMYDEIAPLDRDGLLRHEWLNSRGAIARFDRDAIEIRVVDVQECPQADTAIAAATVAAVRSLYDERFAQIETQQAVPTGLLHDALLATIRDADAAVIDRPEYLDALGVASPGCTARDVWAGLLTDAANDDAWWRPAIDVILREGPLARRILRASGEAPDRARLHAVYAALCQCLEEGRMFHHTLAAG